MKHLFAVLIAYLPFTVAAQVQADALLGKWINIPKQNLEIEIYKTQDQYEGKISWAKDNDERKPLGFVILRNLRFDEKKNEWSGGTIHDPNSGNSYSAEAELEEDGTLNVYAYKGLRFLGKTKNFKRSAAR